MSRMLFKGIVLTSLVMIGGISSVSTAGVLFSDGFESGDFSHKENGFAWGTSNTGGSPAAVAVTTTRVKSGSNSMLMRFAGTGAPNSWTEKRFSFASSPQTDLWVKFDLWIPANLVLANQNGGNNKFMAIYNGDYSSNFQVNFSMSAPNGTFANSVADVQTHMYQNGSELSNDPYGSTHAAKLFDKADLGTWTEIVIHVKCPSATGVSDGAMQLWKNGTKVYSYTNLPIWGRAGYNYMDGAYFLGWANTGFPSATDFYMDNVVFSNTPITPGPAPVSPPLAPTLNVSVAP